ncbi:MAG: MAPEG family protein [Paracoccaceae bacterium]
MPIAITPLYAAPIVALFIYLSIRVIRYRRSNRIAFGDQGDRELLKLMRAQGNCAEYAPIGLLLLLIAELAGAAPLWLHITGLLLVIGRTVHGIGLAHFPRIIPARVVGITCTFTSYLIALTLALF